MNRWRSDDTLHSPSGRSSRSITVIEAFARAASTTWSSDLPAHGRSGRPRARVGAAGAGGATKAAVGAKFPRGSQPRIGWRRWASTCTASPEARPGHAFGFDVSRGTLRRGQLALRAGGRRPASAGLTDVVPGYTDQPRAADDALVGRLVAGAVRPHRAQPQDDRPRRFLRLSGEVAEATNEVGGTP